MFSQVSVYVCRVIIRWFGKMFSVCVFIHVVAPSFLHYRKSCLHFGWLFTPNINSYTHMKQDHKQPQGLNHCKMSPKVACGPWHSYQHKLSMEIVIINMFQEWRLSTDRCFHSLCQWYKRHFCGGSCIKRGLWRWLSNGTLLLCTR